MYNKILRSWTYFIPSLFGILFFVASCKKADISTSITVVMVDYKDRPVDSVTVTFYVDSAKTNSIPQLPNTQITQKDGKASLSFKNGVLIDIKAEKAIRPDSSIIYKGVILLNPGQHDERHLVMKAKL